MTKSKTTCTKPQRASIAELLARGGVAPTSEWTNGQGRYTSRRAVPPHAAVIKSSGVASLRGEVRRNAERLLRARPRVVRLVVVTDLRAARRAVKGGK